MKKNVGNLNNLDVVATLKQTFGKGRNNRVWMSDGDNLYFSILIKERLKHIEVFNYIMVSSLALVKTLDYYNVKSTIKYPNDILVDRKKISGILIETAGDYEIDFIVIGIGLNVNQLDFFDLNQKATSLCLINNQKYELKDVLMKYMEFFNYYGSLNDLNIINEYKNNSLILGKNIKFDDDTFKVLDIYSNGMVQLEGEKGIIEKNFNEISLQNIY